MLVPDPLLLRQLITSFVDILPRLSFSMVKTPHSFQVDLYNTLRLLCCSQQDAVQYIGWQSGEMAEHYSRVSDMAAFVAILEDILPGAVNLAKTPVSHPENLHTLCNI